MAIDESLLNSILTEVERDVRTKNTAAESTTCLKGHYTRILAEHGKGYADIVWNTYSIARHVEMSSHSPQSGSSGTTINNIVQNGTANAAQTASGSQSTSATARGTPEAHGIAHMRAATPLYMLIVGLTFIVSLACITGGIYAIYRNSQSPTEFSLGGAKLSTGHVGVAFVGMGLIIGFFTVRAVLKSVKDIGTTSGK